jgi:hypothetical protein
MQTVGSATPSAQGSLLRRARRSDLDRRLVTARLRDSRKGASLPRPPRCPNDRFAAASRKPMLVSRLITGRAADEQSSAQPGIGGRRASSSWLSKRTRRTTLGAAVPLSRKAAVPGTIATLGVAIAGRTGASDAPKICVPLDEHQRSHRDRQAAASARRCRRRRGSTGRGPRETVRRERRSAEKLASMSRAGRYLGVSEPGSMERDGGRRGPGSGPEWGVLSVAGRSSRAAERLRTRRLWAVRVVVGAIASI